MVKTVDGGARWRELPLVSDRKAIELGVGFADAMHGWIGTSVGGFETRGGGSIFEPAPVPKALNKFRIMPAHDGTINVFAIGTEVQELTLSKGGVGGQKRTGGLRRQADR